MKISELLRRGRTFSFEFFPPKTEAAEAQLERALLELEPLGPSFVSVTYGAGGSTRERTHDLVVHLRRDTSLVPMAHLTCVGHTRAELVDIVASYRAHDVENIIALRGDPPAGSDLPTGDLDHATDLLALIREVGDFCVAVAAHPEGHPASPDRESDLHDQAAKLAAADFGVTQFFFEPDLYTRFVDKLRARGTETPVIPGIMPVTDVKQVARMAAMSGAAFPEWLEAKLRAVQGDADAMRRVGIEEATRLCEALLAAGAPGLHFYTLNRSTATREIFRNLGLAVR